MTELALYGVLAVSATVALKGILTFVILGTAIKKSDPDTMPTVRATNIACAYIGIAVAGITFFINVVHHI